MLDANNPPKSFQIQKKWPRIYFFKFGFLMVSVEISDLRGKMQGKKSLFAIFRIISGLLLLFLLPPSGNFPFEFLKLWFKFIISNSKNTVSPIFKNVTIIFHC